MTAFEPVEVKFCFLRGQFKMIDGSESEKRKRQLAFELQNARVYEKRSRMISGDEVEEFTFVICNALK